MRKQNDKIKLCVEVQKIIHTKISQMNVKFDVVQPEKSTEFYEPTITFLSSKDGEVKSTYRSRIYLKSQEDTVYYFPTKTHQKIVTLVAEILKVMTGREIKIKESPCKKCLKFLKCRMAFPCATHLQQIGSFTKTSCIIFENDSFDKEFMSNLFAPLN